MCLVLIQGRPAVVETSRLLDPAVIQVGQNPPMWLPCQMKQSLPL